MSIYFEPIRIALIIFMLLGFLLIIPWLIYNYRKYGYLSIWQSLVVYSFAYYMLTAFFLVILPLPATRDTCSMQPADTVHYSLIPFTFLKDIISGSSVVLSQPSTYIRLLTQTAFIQAVFNFLLLLPFGVYLRYFFNKRLHWKKAFGLGFALSLFYEVTQITGIYGIYNCPYRIFDVDDLLLNSTGALFGFLLAPILLALFPSQESVLAKAEHKMKSVPPLSQLLAVMIDYFLIKLSWTFTFGFFIKNDFIEFVYTIFAFFIVFSVVPLLGNGKTLGTRFMRFRLVKVSDDQHLWSALLKRTVALLFPIMLIYFSRMFTHMNIDMDSAFYAYHAWASVIILVFQIVMWSVFFLHAIIVLIKGGKRNFYFDHVAKLHPEKEKTNLN